MESLPASAMTTTIASSSPSSSLFFTSRPCKNKKPSLLFFSSSSSSSSSYSSSSLSRGPPLVSALKRPKGFGPQSNNKKTKTNKKNQTYADDEDDDDADDDEEEEEEEEEDVATTMIPEVVTNRMIRRMGLSVGVPLAMGLMFFPFFYYLKVVAKVDVPSWVPVIVSFIFFGTALLGISYGIVSSSWDPLREGSLLGWNEARRNWPLFWDSLWGRKPSTATATAVRPRRPRRPKT